MDFRTLLTYLFSVILFACISCEEPQTGDEGEPQQPSSGTDPTTVIDTSDMEMIDGVPVISTPGAQIDKDKVVDLLEEGNTSYSEVLKAREEDEVEKNIESLEQLLHSGRLRKDKELRFMIHTMVGNSYLKRYEYTDQNSDLDQAEEHLNSSISLFEGNPEYKTDLADAYTSRIAVLSLRRDYAEVVSQMKYLIEEFQNIGYGLYNNWFACRQVDALYNMIDRDLLDSDRSEEILKYFADIADKYHNEVGITAQMALAQHYAEENLKDKSEALTESVEKQLESLNNPKFKEDKWLQFKTEVESIQKGTVAQGERDTLFYEINPDMVGRARISKDEHQSTYRISLQLKQDYHSEFAEQTSDNIGNYLAIMYEKEVISPRFPTIQTGIPSGRFSIGPFEEEEDAQRIYQQILN